MNESSKRSLAARMRRIEGQVRGVSRMIEEDRYCVDVITQLQAIRAALKRVEEAVLKDHVAHCVEHAIATGDREDQRRKVQELLGIIERL
jgi:DNA-binding FrmR family transcriptional regulator